MFDDDPGPTPPVDLYDGPEPAYEDEPPLETGGSAGDATEPDDDRRRIHRFYEAHRQADASREPVLPDPLDWARLWEHDETSEDFIVAPVIAAGRSHEIYAGAKTGKSEVVLYLLAQAATGRAALEQPAGPPRSIVYIDLEMTEDDVRDRLTDMGFAGTVFDHLHYYLLPSLPPLNTREGGEALLAICRRHQASLVVIDTIGRAVVGDENSADTIQAFHRYTGVTLKAAGIAVVRLDHTGKDATRGARGSSAKNDDVDVVFRLERTDSGARLHATHRRVSWIPEKIDLLRSDDPVRYELVPFSWPAGTGDTADLLDKLGAPLTITRRAARQLLTDNQEGRRNDVISAAIKYRRHEAERVGDHAKSGSPGPSGDQGGDHE